MIQASDLRIGNWYDHNGEYKQASHNTIYEVWESEREWCKGIPLTPEVLEKCGFHKHNNAWVQEDFTENNSKFYFSIWSVDNEEFNYNSAEFPIELKYLHQLQNLIYVIKGEELTYKP
jgi:hypothetical protein